MPYDVHVASFDGPLDLLLQLVESNELDITTLSLIQVTEPFVAHVKEHQGKIPPEELADFLVVAAKLVYLKSKAILPELHDPLLEEGPDLETQLRMYKAFVEAAAKLGELARSGRTSFGRAAPLKLPAEQVFSPPVGVTGFSLVELFRGVIRRLEPIAQLPKAALERAVTIEEKIEELRTKVKNLMRVSFHRYLSESSSKQEMVVAFLALLELVKQRVVSVKQGTLFEDIELETA
jgi:segregation and condensation protein A